MMSLVTETIDDALLNVQDQLTQLVDLVNQAILAAIKALIDQDELLARQVNMSDSRINQGRIQLEESCTRWLAHLQCNDAQASRLVGAVNVATNLERIGDHAASIAFTTLRLRKKPALGAALADASVVVQMAEIAREMVEGAVSAFLSSNDLLAERIVRRDREIQDLHEQFLFNLAHRLIHDESGPETILFLLTVCHNLIRIADRAANICERTIYVVTGELKEFR